MTTEIERMAREAGCFKPGRRGDYWGVTDDTLARLAALVAAAEREQCAKVCDAIESEPLRQGREEYDMGRSTGAEKCAAAIRAGGKP